MQFLGSCNNLIRLKANEIIIIIQIISALITLAGEKVIYEAKNTMDRQEVHKVTIPKHQSSWLSEKICLKI